MMVLATPIPHQSFEAEMFHRLGSVSAHAEFPSSSIPPLAPLRPPLQFPPLQHANTSPYPMTQSFSALGPPEPSFSRAPLPNAAPPAPKQGTIALPPDSGDLHPQPSLPSISDPSQPTNKTAFAVTMVALAPPADDGRRPPLLEVNESSNADSKESETSIPRRLPAVNIDTNVPIPGPPSAEESSDSANSMKRGKLPRADTQSVMSRSSSGGRAKSGERRARTRRQYSNMPAPSNRPSSARMIENRSAEARARLRSGGAMMTRYHTSAGTGYSSAQSSPGLSRVLMESAPTPPRSIAADLSPPDLGGLDGLEAKVVLLGSQGVGKTSLILRYTSGAFSRTPTPATIGNSLYTRKLVLDGVRVKLQIWDTAGQERFRSMAPIYYRGAHVCVLVYDISNRQSFDDVKSWLDELGRTVPKETVIYVVGAKLDLEKKREVSYSQARRILQSWLKPPESEPDAPPPQPSRSIFRSASGRSRPDSLLPTPTPVRSHSFHALASVEAGTMVPPISRTAFYGDSSSNQGSQSISYSNGVASPPSRSQVINSEPPAAPKSIILNSSSTSITSGSGTTGSPFPAVFVTSPILSRSPNRVSFPALQTPSKPTFATFTEPVKPSITPSVQISRHGVSGGRFSISDVLGITRSPSSSGAVSNLAQLAEANPVSPERRRRHDSLAVPSSDRLLNQSQSSSPSRSRTESSPLLPSRALSENPRRKSEDWSGRGWRLGEGPGVAGALEEFGAGVRQKDSADMGISASTSSGFIKKTNTQSVASGSHNSRGRVRGGSLGRDSRLYNDPPSTSFGSRSVVPTNGAAPGYGPGAVNLCDHGDEDEGDDWGVVVEGVRIGECSALTGEGVEALFRSISSVLVGRKDKIERERTLRHKNSVMLVDPADDSAAGSGGSKSSSRQTCCV